MRPILTLTDRQDAPRSDGEPSASPLHDEALRSAILKSAAQLGGLLEMAPDRRERSFALTALKIAVMYISKALRA